MSDLGVTMRLENTFLAAVLVLLLFIIVIVAKLEAEVADAERRRLGRARLVVNRPLSQFAVFSGTSRW